MDKRQAYALLHPIVGVATFEVGCAYGLRLEKRYDTKLWIWRNRDGKAVWHARVSVLSSSLSGYMPLQAWPPERRARAERLLWEMLLGVGEGSIRIREKSLDLVGEVEVSGSELAAMDRSWVRATEARRA